jgi:hypothetical protein
MGRLRSAVSSLFALFCGIHTTSFPERLPRSSSSNMVPSQFLLAKIPLRRASLGRRATIIPAAPNICRGPQFPRVRISLTRFLFRHATASRQDTFLQAATKFFQDSQSLQISFLGVTRRPAAIRRPLCRFFVTPEDFTAASSGGTSRRSTSLGPCFSHSRTATVSAFVPIGRALEMVPVLSNRRALVLARMASVSALMASVFARVAFFQASIFSPGGLHFI